MEWPDGQQRRAWLDQQDERLRNALSYYLGPAYEPVNALAQVGAMLSPGSDMMDMATASRDLMQSENAPNALANAGWLGLAALGMAVPGSVGGYRSAADDAVAQADEVLGLLRSGRAGEITDEMLAASDQRRLFEGYDLPMDEASRMARAKKSGFRDGYYHGTGENFPAFDADLAGSASGHDSAAAGVWVTREPLVANQFTPSENWFGSTKGQSNGWGGVEPIRRWKAADDGYKDGAQIYPLMVNVAGAKPVTGAQASRMIFDGGDDFRAAGAEFADFASQAKAGGATGISIGAHRAPRAAEMSAAQHVVFDPKNIRSKFARFDPRLAHLRNLLAGSAAVGVGLNALSAPPEEERY